jgi:hypothetical protein
MMFDLSHPQKQAVFAGPVLRSLKQHPGWINNMLFKSKVMPMWSPSGLWLGNVPVFELDLERFQRSLLKIVRGLYFLIRKSPFPPGGRIIFAGKLNTRTQPLIASIEEHLFPQTFSFGDDVFEWRFSQSKDGITMWKLMFYRSVVFYALGFDNAGDLD